MSDQVKDLFRQKLKEDMEGVKQAEWKNKVLEKLELAEELAPRKAVFLHSNFFYPMLAYSCLLILFWGIKPLLDGFTETSFMQDVANILISPTALSLMLCSAILLGIDIYLQSRRMKN